MINRVMTLIKNGNIHWRCCNEKVIDRYCTCDRDLSHSLFIGIGKTVNRTVIFQPPANGHRQRGRIHAAHEIAKQVADCRLERIPTQNQVRKVIHMMTR